MEDFVFILWLCDLICLSDCTQSHHLVPFLCRLCPCLQSCRQALHFVELMGEKRGLRDFTKYALTHSHSHGCSDIPFFVTTALCIRSMLTFSLWPGRSNWVSVGLCCYNVRNDGIPGYHQRLTISGLACSLAPNPTSLVGQLQPGIIIDPATNKRYDVRNKAELSRSELLCDTSSVGCVVSTCKTSHHLPLSRS